MGSLLLELLTKRMASIVLDSISSKYSFDINLYPEAPGGGGVPQLDFILSCSVKVDLYTSRVPQNGYRCYPLSSYIYVSLCSRDAVLWSTLWLTYSCVLTYNSYFLARGSHGRKTTLIAPLRKPYQFVLWDANLSSQQPLTLGIVTDLSL